MVSINLTDDDILANWATLNSHLVILTEDHVAKLLKKELSGKCRKQILLRLHQRLSSLRTERERLELLKHAK